MFHKCCISDDIWWLYFIVSFSKNRFKHFWFCPIGLLSTNTTCHNHIWSNWCHETFLKVSYWTGCNKYYTSWPYLIELILCDLFEGPFETFFIANHWTSVNYYLRSVYDRGDFVWVFSKVSYRTVFKKFFIPARYLMDLISWDLFSKFQIFGSRM